MHLGRRAFIARVFVIDARNCHNSRQISAQPRRAETIMRQFCLLFILAITACANPVSGGSGTAADTAKSQSKDAGNPTGVKCAHSADCPNKTDLCVDGKCAAKVCEPGSAKCAGGNFQYCNAIGMAWIVTPCENNNACTIETCDLEHGCVHQKSAKKDQDGDGFCSVASGGNDCNDANSQINPGWIDDCNTVGVDDNCDGVTDKECAGAFHCKKDGDPCGGKGKCSEGHCFWLDDRGYTWTLVPEGTFWMGCNAALDEACIGSELPQHLVDMSPYWIGVYEVTYEIYQNCWKASATGCTAIEPEFLYMGGIDDHPANGLSWMQAQSVCLWLNGDLPSEAQWEKGARGGCAHYPGADCAKVMPTYPWGEEPPVCGTHANGNCCPEIGFFPTTCAKQLTPVGAASASGRSPYGAYDVAGNVAEFTLDFPDVVFNYATQAKPNAKDPVQVNKTPESAYLGHIYRGTSLETAMGALRSARRGVQEDGWYLTGVRCARKFNE